VIDFSGATLQDRTGDLLITNFQVYPYVIHSQIGQRWPEAAISACRALIESDFESNFASKSATTNIEAPQSRLVPTAGSFQIIVSRPLFG
jgi:hypothetical protein